MLKPMNVKFWEETCASHENAVLPFSILQQKSPSPQQCSSRPIKNHNPALHVLSQDISKLLEHPQHFSEKQVHLTCLLHCLYSRRPRGGGGRHHGDKSAIPSSSTQSLSLPTTDSAATQLPSFSSSVSTGRYSS